MGRDRIEERYQAFIQNSSEGIWLCELEKPIPITTPVQDQVKHIFKYGVMTDANEAMAAMYAVASRDDIIGKRVNELLVEDDQKNIDYLTAFVESGYKLNGVESHEKDALGNDKIFRNSLVGYIEDGKVYRAWGTQQDVTEHYKALQAVQQSEERLALALAVSGTGMWEWDMVTNKLIWSDELKRLFGLDPSEEITYQKYLTLLHPDDGVRMRSYINNAIANGEEYHVEHRILWPDKSVHWIVGHGKAFYENGVPVRMLGTSRNIEDTKRNAELEILNQELKNQQEELEKINQAKDEFISLASHQLRTPATAVKQYISMVLQGYIGDATTLSPEQVDGLEKAYSSNERQLAIINDLLRVAQLDAGRIQLNKKESDIIGLVEKIVSNQSPKFTSKNQKVTVNALEPKIMAHIDNDRLLMALENIIDNASKYTPEKRNITIQVYPKKSSTVIDVIDEGIGISKKDIPRLFQKFSRLEDPLLSDVSGTGLGLYWASKIILLHGGTLSVESKRNQGSKFTIEIPTR